MKSLLLLSILLFCLSVFSQEKQIKKEIGQDQIEKIVIDENGYKTSTLFGTCPSSEYFLNKNLVWSSPVKVSDYTNEDSRDMGIAIGPDSTIHIVYCDDVPGYPSISRQRITYKYKKVGGTWSSAMIIDEFSGVAARNNHEASINVSDNGDIHVVFHYWAYDGTGRNQIGYSKYTKATDTWTTELISGNTGTVYATYSDYPRIVSTTNNIPVAAWGNDNTNGYDEAYLTYNNGTWQTPIQISSLDSNKAQFPVPVSIGNEKVFVLFREYNVTQDTLALYYRIFDASNGTLSNINKIQDSERPSTSNYDSYYLYDACYTNNDKVFILFNSEDTLYSYSYDVTTTNLIKNPQTHKSNYTAGYTNYNLPSVCSDDAGKIHIAYTVWNTSNNSVRYLNYDEVNGFSSSEIISANDCLDAPQIVFGADSKLHIVYADDSEDTNNDGYVDREVYYLCANNTNGIRNANLTEQQIKIYPNPSKGIFNIDTDKLSKVIVRDINGKIILNTLSDSKVDISNFSNGLYILSISNEDGVAHYKIVKK